MPEVFQLRPDAANLSYTFGGSEPVLTVPAGSVVEIGTGVRPAFLDNLPRIRWREGVLHVNGFFRHGFLLAPALARMTADVLMRDARFPEVMDEDHRERRRA